MVVPIIASGLTKNECRGLVDKMRTQIQVWSSRIISYARRIMLINTVIFGMVSYWASIFIPPKEVLDTITQLCRNFLWTGTTDFKYPPHISWKIACLPKNHGGLGIADISV